MNSKNFFLLILHWGLVVTAAGVQFGVPLQGVKYCTTRVNSCHLYCEQHPGTHVQFTLSTSGDISCMLVNATKGRRDGTFYNLIPSFVIKFRSSFY